MNSNLERRRWGIRGGGAEQHCPPARQPARTRGFCSERATDEVCCCSTARAAASNVFVLEGQANFTSGLNRGNIRGNKMSLTKFEFIRIERYRRSVGRSCCLVKDSRARVPTILFAQTGGLYVGRWQTDSAACSLAKKASSGHLIMKDESQSHPGIASACLCRKYEGGQPESLRLRGGHKRLSRVA